MRIATGKVVDGKVVTDGEPLVEGTTVAIVALDDDEAFDLTEAEERELIEALAQADRGEGIDGEELLEQLEHSR